MIVVAGSAPIRPESREQALAAIHAMVAATRQEAGCITYVFSADLDDPCRFWIYEEWESLDHLHAHFNTPHMAAFRSQLPALLAGEASVRQFTVRDITAL